MSSSVTLLFPIACALPPTHYSYAHQNGEQSEDYETEGQLQARILNAALEFVPQHSWSAEAIAAGAEVSPGCSLVAGRA